MEWFTLARYEGRDLNINYLEQNFTMLGWNMYLPPEYCAEGILIFDSMNDYNEDCAGSDSYYDLSKFEIFRNQDE